MLPLKPVKESFLASGVSLAIFGIPWLAVTYITPISAYIVTDVTLHSSCVSTSYKLWMPVILD